MPFKLRFTQEAETQLNTLENNTHSAKRLKAVRKSLAYLESNPKHKYTSLSKMYGKEIFEAYAENNTPAAYRIFWCYGPEKDNITIISITPHP
jgi:hypothetical protein